MSTDWISPTLTREGDAVVITSPNPYPCIGGADRLEVVTGDDYERCPQTAMEHGRICPCSLVVGHVGPHWLTSPEFAAEIGVLQIAAVLSA
jgi:hypothetical protein